MLTRTDDPRQRASKSDVAARLKVGDTAPAVTVLDASGHSLALNQVWRHGPVVLTFLRHFGLLFCRNWLAQLEQHRARFEEEGLNVVAIGLGEPKHAAYFGRRLAPSVACLSRSTPEAHAAYGIGRVSLEGLLQPAQAATAVRAVVHGHMQGKATGDARVLSGTFLIDSTGVIRFAHYARFPGDDPAIDDILRAAEELQSEVKL